MERVLFSIFFPVSKAMIIAQDEQRCRFIVILQDQISTGSPHGKWSLWFGYSWRPNDAIKTLGLSFKPVNPAEFSRRHHINSTYSTYNYATIVTELEQQQHILRTILARERVAEECEFYLGKLEGVFMHYLQTGELDYKTTYHLGLKHGLEHRYSGGVLQSRINFAQGEKHGEEEEFFVLEGYHPILQQRQSWKHNKLHGIVEEFYMTGVRSSVIIFEKGKIIDGEYPTWHTNGVLSSITKYQNGKRNGEFQKYSPNGKLHCQGSYKESMLHNDYILFDTDGTVEERRHYE